MSKIGDKQLVSGYWKVDSDLELNFETHPFNEYRLNHEMKIRHLFGLSSTISYGDIDRSVRLPGHFSVVQQEEMSLTYYAYRRTI